MPDLAVRPARRREGAEGLQAADSATAGRHELVAGAVAGAALSRFADGPAVWPVAATVAVAVALGAVQLLRAGDRRLPGDVSAGAVVPAVAAFAAVAAIRLVPVGLGLVVALAVAAILLDRSIRIEHRIAVVPRQPSEAERTAVLVQALVVAFLAFLGAAALVPGGLPEPGGSADGRTLSQGGLVVLAVADAAIAGLLGFRAATLRGRPARTALPAAATYAAAVAIAAAALRATEIPRLVGPALLTLVFFLWDAIQVAPPARPRDPRWIWQTVLLAALGAVVVAWNLALG